MVEDIAITFGTMCRLSRRGETVQHQLVAVLGRGNPDDLMSYLKRQSHQGLVSEKKAGALPVREMVRYQMACAAVRQHCVSVASGVESGKVRFNLLLKN